MNSTLRFGNSCLYTLMMLVLWTEMTGHAASPPNDAFVDATEFVVTPGVTTSIEFSGTIANATVESGEENNLDLATYNLLGTIWWKWNCITSSIVEFVVYSSTASLVAGAFEGSSVSNLTTVSPPYADPFFHPEFTFDAGVATFEGEPGKTYWFAAMPNFDLVQPLGAVQGSFTVTPRISPPPVVAPTNDYFADRLVITGTNLTVEGTNAGASTEAGENIGPGWIVVKATVWYSWVSPTNGVVYFSGSAPNPEFSFSLGVYRGESLGSLTTPQPTGDGGFVVAPGDTFQLQIGSAYDTGWGRGGGTGAFNLNVRMNVRAPASSNDQFADRLDVTVPGYHFEGSIYNATREVGEPIPAGNQQQTLWWRFLAPEDGLLRVTVSGPFPANVAVYDGASFETMIPVMARGGNRYVVEDGREYSIQVASGNVPSGGFAIDTLFRSSSNDMFAGSVRLEGTNCTAEGDPINGTFEPGEPNPGMTNTIWYSWAAPATGRAWCSPIENWWRSMRIYKGATLQSLVPIRYVSADNGVFCILAEEGTVYHFQYAGDDYAPLTFSLILEPFLPASNDDFFDARLIKAQGGSERRSVAGATLELGEPSHQQGIASKSIWWKWQAPYHGRASFFAERSLVPGVVMGVYQGTTVDALTLIAKNTNGVSFSAIGGQTYYVAAAVPEDAIGDVSFYWQLTGVTVPALAIPGNLLRVPSWEGTFLTPQYWGISGSIGGYVNERGGADGTTWPVLSSGASVWQDIPTVPGHHHNVRFAFSGVGARVQVTWDAQELGIVQITQEDGNYWHWVEFPAYASNATSRVRFKNLGGMFENAHLDAFSVVDLSAAPSVIRQPSSISTVGGGTAAFFVGVNGSAPLSYQWFHNDSPLPEGTSRILTLESTAAEQAGQYRVRVSNQFGAVTSAVAQLTVDSPTNATIVLQPYGDRIPVGSYFNVSVAAAGTPPLTYQWFFNGEPVTDATNHNLVLPSVQLTNAGTYEVRVENYGGIVWSLPAGLVVTNAFQGGGLIDFRNRFLSSGIVSNEAPVFDLDGSTPLNGPGYVAQLYAGPSIESLRPIASPSPFRTGYYAGFFVSVILSMPNVAPAEVAFAQVRVWEISKGSSYEEARALGSKFGRSEILQVTLGGGFMPPTRLAGLTSFSLQAGLPSFTVGRIDFVERQPGNTVVWSVQGERGFRYVVEKSLNADPFLWRPFTILTNTSGTETFTDSANSGNGRTFYRARILD